MNDDTEDALLFLFRLTEEHVGMLGDYWLSKGGKYTSPDTTHLSHLWKTDRSQYFQQAEKCWLEHKQSDFTQQFINARLYLYHVFYKMIHTLNLVDVSKGTHLMVLRLVDMYVMNLIDNETYQQLEYTTDPSIIS